MPATLAMILLAAAVAAGPGARRVAPVRTPREARTIAEGETGGLAVSARRVPLNGATGGWEVDLHMAGEARGWRCVIDSDTRAVHTRTRIPNPRPPKRR